MVNQFLYFFKSNWFFPVAVVVGFFCCWAPFHAQRLVIIYASEWEYIHEFNVWMFFATGIFYYFSSTLNPILYNVMSRKMRKAFKYTFSTMCSKQRISRNSDLSTTTFHGRNSRSFREETQVFYGNGRMSVKKKDYIGNDLGNDGKYDLIQLNNESIVWKKSMPYLYIRLLSNNNEIILTKISKIVEDFLTGAYKISSWNICI